MATCDFMDSVTMEVLGQATFQNALIDHVVIEVLGIFNGFNGTIDLDHITVETLGQMPHIDNMDHVTLEVLGVWIGCPSCS